MSLRSFIIGQEVLDLCHAEQSGEVHWVTFQAVFVKLKCLSKFLLNMSNFAQYKIEVTSEQ
jgi:hypothetical protein